MKKTFFTESAIAVLLFALSFLLYMAIFSYMDAIESIPLFLVFAISSACFAAICGLSFYYLLFVLARSSHSVYDTLRFYSAVHSVAFLLVWIFSMMHFYHLYGFRNLIINILVPMMSFSAMYFCAVVPFGMKVEENINSSADIKRKRNARIFWGEFFVKKAFYHEIMYGKILQNLDVQFSHAEEIDDTTPAVKQLITILNDFEFILKNLEAICGESHEFNERYAKFKIYEEKMKKIEDMRFDYVEKKAEELKYVLDEHSSKYGSEVEIYKEEARQKFPGPPKP